MGGANYVGTSRSFKEICFFIWVLWEDNGWYLVGTEYQLVYILMISQWLLCWEEAEKVRRKIIYKAISIVQWKAVLIVHLREVLGLAQDIGSCGVKCRSILEFVGGPSGFPDELEEQVKISQT